LGPPVDADALVGRGLLLVALLVAASLEGRLPRHVAARAQDLARGAHARALVVARVRLGPLVGRLGPVPQPAGVIALAVEQAHHARAAEADARALAALVVEVPPALAVLQQADDLVPAVELIAGLQADAVPAAHLAELLGVQPDPRAAALLDRGVEVLVPVHADGDRRRRRRRRRRRQRELLVMAPVGRRPATQRLGLGLGHRAPSPPSLETIVRGDPRIARGAARACGLLRAQRGVKLHTSFATTVERPR